MKRSIFFLALFIISCNTSKTNNVEIGKKLPNNLELKNKINLLVSPAQFEECYKIRIDSIDYLISIDKEKRFKFISTFDKKFISLEGVKVGMKLPDVIQRSKQTLRLINGWAYVLPLNSGWNAAFEISNYDSNTMSPDSTVKWIYKRK